MAFLLSRRERENCYSQSKPGLSRKWACGLWSAASQVSAAAQTMALSSGQAAPTWPTWPSRPWSGMIPAQSMLGGCPIHPPALALQSCSWGMGGEGVCVCTCAHTFPKKEALRSKPLKKCVLSLTLGCLLLYYRDLQNPSPTEMDACKTQMHK